MSWRKRRTSATEIDAVLRPILALGRFDLISDLRQDLAAAGVVEAVARHDTPALFDWMLGQAQLQGISDQNAIGFTARHGAVGWADLQDQFGSVAITRSPLPSSRCPRLSSYWHFAGCGYEKTTRRCAEPGRINRCSLPQLPLRNGRLSQGAVAFFLFVRDVCEGDLIGWLDDQLAKAACDAGTHERATWPSPHGTDGYYASPVAIQPRQRALESTGMHFNLTVETPPRTPFSGPEPAMNLAGCGERPEPTDPPARSAFMREGLLGPMSEIFGVGRRVLSMILADLLLAADPCRPLWIETGASMIAVDTLVHNFLHRTGTLAAFHADHPYGDRCYGENGCAAIIEHLAAGIDARRYNSAFPAIFPRFIQHAIWQFCAGSSWNICNGNRIYDNAACQHRTCPAFDVCGRRPLRPNVK